MIDDHVMVKDGIYLFDDVEVKMHRREKRMTGEFLQHHDDVWMKMVQQILVYKWDHILQEHKQLPMLWKMKCRQNLCFHQ
jgi:hypothetical protein